MVSDALSRLPSALMLDPSIDAPNISANTGEQEFAGSIVTMSKDFNRKSKAEYRSDSISLPDYEMFVNQPKNC